MASLEFIDATQIEIVDDGFVTRGFVDLKNLVSDVTKQCEDFLLRCTISFARLGLAAGSFAYPTELWQHFKDDGWSLKGHVGFQAFHDQELGALDTHLDGSDSRDAYLLQQFITYSALNKRLCSVVDSISSIDQAGALPSFTIEKNKEGDESAFFM